MLNREIIQNQDEKEFVTSLIMSDKCCQVLIPYIKLNYFDIDYTRTVVSWVMDYYKKFRNSPKQDIISVYRSRCDEIQDDALKELILNYIQELGKNEIAINNEDYLVDKCKDFIDYKAMEIYTEEIQSCLDTKNMDKARQIQSEYRKVSTVNTNEVDIMDPNSIATIVDDLNEVDEELFTLPDVLTDVIGKIHRNDFIAILAPPKKGKCLKKHTPILMYDGSIKEVQDIVPGDKLMGPDSKPRNVESTCKGFGEMYRVKSRTNKLRKFQTPDIDFTCNGDHILVLKNNSKKYRKPIEKYKSNGELNGNFTLHNKLNFLKQDEVEISVNDYLKLSDTQKRNLKLFRCAVEYEEKKHIISPYLIGVWLGDGTSSSAEITNTDDAVISEVVYELNDLGDECVYKNGLSLRCHEQGNNRKESKFHKELKKLNLLNNKHIPVEYLIDSRKNRLELLAGLIDTDGYTTNDGRYEINIMNKKLAEDIANLSRQLGFRTFMVEKYKQYKNMYDDTNGWKYSWTVKISGCLSEIPVRIEYKKLQDTKKFSSLNNTFTFDIEPVGKDDYYGFVLDGDHRFLLGDTTVSHNTWILQYLGILAMKQHLNVTVVSMEMTRAETVQRLWKTLFGVKSGTVKPGKYETAKFVEDCNEQRKFRAEPFDFVVKEDAGKDVSSLQKELRRNNQYQGHLEVIAYPAFGESVIGITNKIEEMAENGFVTDVLIIDYADITKPIGGSSEVRHQLDAIWKHLRGFASKFHCAVITASQTNRSGLSSSVIGGEAIGEDFRKLAHITSMVSLEQTPKMRKNHVMRIRNIALRKGESKDEPCVFCQCLPLGQFVFGEVIPASDYISVDDDDEEDADE